MSRSSRTHPSRRSAGAPAVRSAPAHADTRAVIAGIGVLLLVTPLLVLPNAKESFRLIQGMTAACLALVTVVFATFGLRRAGAVAWTAVLGRTAPRTILPLVLVAGITRLTSPHSAHVDAALADLTIGAVAVIVWSFAIDADRLLGLVRWTIAPAVIVAALGLDQYLGVTGLLDGLRIDAPTPRLRITSTVGNPGDLAAMLVLPLLAAFDALATASARRHPALLAASVVLLAALAVTATLAATGALAVATVVWAWRRGRVTLSVLAQRPAVAAIAGGLAVVALTAAIAGPLRVRLGEKVAQAAQGDVNAMLTGRLDGWRAAVAMVGRQPILGVGHGAFRAEFADTRLALMARGVTFFPEQHQVILATPHNEPLGVAAETGLAGVAALTWAVWSLLRAVRRIRADDRRALAWACLGALAVLSAFWFPLHVASSAWPWLVCLAWICREADEARKGDEAA